MRRAVFDVDWRVCGLIIGRASLVRRLEPSDEKFAGKGNVDVHVAVHCMLAQQVNSKLFARFCEAPLPV